MKLKKIKMIINDNDFENARLVIYFILFIAFIYLAYFSRFKCPGCPLCGMTRALKRLLVLDFKSAFEFNRMIWILCILIPFIIIDIAMIIKRRCLKDEK